MTDTTNSAVHIQNRINKLYQSNAYYLSGTSVATAVTTYFELVDPTSTDLNTLRIAINNYKDGLSASNVIKFAAANTLLQAVESEFVFDKVGAVSLSSNFAQEHINGHTYENIAAAIKSSIVGQTTASGYATAIANSMSGLGSDITTTLIETLTTAIEAGTAVGHFSSAITALTTKLNSATTAAAIAAAVYDGIYIVDSNPVSHTDRTAFQTDVTDYFTSDLAVTLSSAIGGNDISDVSSTDDNTITGVLGDTALTGVDLLGVETSAAGSLSAAAAATYAAVQAAIGTAAIAPSVSISPASCTYDGSAYSIGSAIYTTSNVVSTTINNIIACGKWANGGGDLYFSHDATTGSCTSLLDPGEAFATCVDYLGALA
jgi:ABC-type uncharacterized transport system substrate-binding protein